MIIMMKRVVDNGEETYYWQVYFLFQGQNKIVWLSKNLTFHARDENIYIYIDLFI